MSRARLALALLFPAALAVAPACAAPEEEPDLPEATDDAALNRSVPAVDDVKVTILSDMIVSSGTVAEWGFSAWVEITKDGKKTNILFDTGASDRVIGNATKLGIDICTADDVVLSHNHGDHTQGLVPIRTFCKDKNPNAAIRAHVGGPEIFWPRTMPNMQDDNVMIDVKPKYEALGGTFVTDDKLTPLANIAGVWTSGKITRMRDEKVHPTDIPMTTPTGEKIEDQIPEEQALVINTKKGLVVITGCGHAGLTNTLEHVRNATKQDKVFALVGGLHLFAKPVGTNADVGSLTWETTQLGRMKPTYILGGHCTGLERVFFMREKLNIPEKNASISTIGAQLTMDGIVAGRLAGAPQ